MKFSRFAVSGAMCAALLGFGAVTATQAAAAESSVAAPQVAAQPVPGWEVYYENWFYSAASCEARGSAIVNPASSQHIPGALDFDCWLGWGETRWSMSILWCDCRLSSGDTRRSMSVHAA
ncbi:Secreted protein [Kibdelosporangium persicum]